MGQAGCRWWVFPQIQPSTNKVGSLGINTSISSSLWWDNHDTYFIPSLSCPCRNSVMIASRIKLFINRSHIHFFSILFFLLPYTQSWHPLILNSKSCARVSFCGNLAEEAIFLLTVCLCFYVSRVSLIRSMLCCVSFNLTTFVFSWNIYPT